MREEKSEVGYNCASELMGRTCTSPFCPYSKHSWLKAPPPSFFLKEIKTELASQTRVNQDYDKKTSDGESPLHFNLIQY